MVANNVYEMYGIEDPRITLIDGTYYINYSAISPETGVTTCLASTKDFKTFQRHGVIFTPDNKDISIFPAKIGGKYYALNRPASAEYGFRDIWMSQSPDLLHWGRHESIMQCRPGFWTMAASAPAPSPASPMPVGWRSITAPARATATASAPPSTTRPTRPRFSDAQRSR